MNARRRRDPDMGRKYLFAKPELSVAAQVPALRIEAMGGPPPHEARTKSREDARMMPAPDRHRRGPAAPA